MLAFSSQFGIDVMHVDMDSRCIGVSAQPGGKGHQTQSGLPDTRTQDTYWLQNPFPKLPEHSHPGADAAEQQVFLV